MEYTASTLTHLLPELLVFKLQRADVAHHLTLEPSFLRSLSQVPIPWASIFRGTCSDLPIASLCGVASDGPRKLAHPETKTCSSRDYNLLLTFLKHTPGTRTCGMRHSRGLAGPFSSSIIWGPIICQRLCTSTQRMAPGLFIGVWTKLGHAGRGVPCICRKSSWHTDRLGWIKRRKTLIRRVEFSLLWLYIKLMF